MSISPIDLGIPHQVTTHMTTITQVRARWAAAFGLFLTGLWILHGFLVPIAWAVVLGITLWPLYAGLKKHWTKPSDSFLPALIVTLVMAGIVYGPLTYGLLQVGQEAQSVLHLLQHAHQGGLPTPDWILGLPKVGPQAAELWQHWLGSSAAVKDLLKQIVSSELPHYTRQFASLIFHRYASAFFTFVVLFFLLLNGELLGRRVLYLCDRAFGDNGSRYALHAMTAVRATVNGIVLVALGQGVALGFGYAAAGFAHAALMGVITGLIALVPFAAKIMSVGAAFVLFGEGKIGPGLGLFVFGLLIIILSDNYLKPKLIGNAVKLPFIWTLLGILGGIETFGFLGLFLGPTIMAILISVWRDSLSDSQDGLVPRE